MSTFINRNKKTHLSSVHFFISFMALFSVVQTIYAVNNNLEKILIMGAHSDQFSMYDHKSYRSELLKMENVFFLDNFSYTPIYKEKFLRQEDQNFDHEENFNRYQKYKDVEIATRKGYFVSPEKLPKNTYAYDFNYLERFSKEHPQHKFDVIIFDDSVFKFFDLKKIKELGNMLNDDGLIFIPYDTNNVRTFSELTLKAKDFQDNYLAFIILNKTISPQKKEEEIQLFLNNMQNMSDEEKNSAFKRGELDFHYEAKNLAQRIVSSFNDGCYPDFLLRDKGVLTKKSIDLLIPYFDNALANMMRMLFEENNFRQNNINLMCIDNEALLMMNNTTAQKLKKEYNFNRAEEKKFDETYIFEKKYEQLPYKEYIVLMKKESEARFPILDQCLEG